MSACNGAGDGDAYELCSASSTAADSNHLTAAQSSSLASSSSVMSLPIKELSTCLAYMANDQSREQKPLLDFLVSSPSQHSSSSGAIVICFLRRFGCPVCRALSAGISLMGKRFDFEKHNIKLFAVAIEDVGYEKYRDGNYFSGPVLINSDGSAFKTMRLKKLGISNAYGAMDIMRVKAAIALANAEYYKKTHDFKGNAVQLGGMFIFDPTMSRCVFEFREKYAGNSPTLVDVLNSLRTLAPDNESIDSKRISELDGKQKILDLAREAALERSAN